MTLIHLPEELNNFYKKPKETLQEYVDDLKEDLKQFEFHINDEKTHAQIHMIIERFFEEIKQTFHLIRIPDGDRYMFIDLDHMKLDFEVLRGDDEKLINDLEDLKKVDPKHVIIYPKNTDTLLLFQQIKLKNI